MNSIISQRFAHRSPRVYLDELLRIPVLRAQEMAPDQLAIVASHRPPLSPRQALRVLSSEFATPVTATDPSRYFDLQHAQDVARAAQLIGETLRVWRKRADRLPQDDYAALARAVHEFVREECVKLGAEMDTGDTERWSGESFLYGEWRAKLTPDQLQMTRSAFDALAGTPRIHPLVKKEILGHVCSVISKSQ